MPPITHSLTCLAIAGGLLFPTAVARSSPAAEDDAARFRSELTGALRRGDSVALALLVHFPLRVNLADGTSLLIDDELSLQRRFEELFPPAFRQRVLAIEPGHGDGWSGPGYRIAAGALWAQNYAPEQGPPGLRIEVVNLPAITATDQRGSRPTLFACETATRRLVIDDATPPGRIRYRAWNRPRFPPDAPDAEWSGEAELVGSGGCARMQWRFRAGEDELMVEENRCSAGSDAAPDAARAIVSLRPSGGVQRAEPCF